MAEIRPWVGTSISVAQFKLLKPATIIDCSSGHDRKPTWYFEEPEPDKREQAVWTQIDEAFSEPVTASDDVADYAPTQIICESFKQNGLDGVAYRSSLGKGHNIALFDIGGAEPINCSLYQVESIDFKFEETAESWCSAAHYGLFRKA